MFNVYDSEGLKIFTTQEYQESIIDLSSLPAGIYFYDVVDGVQILTAGKLMKL